MITSPASHDYPSVNQFSVVSAQPAVAHTNRSSVASKIGNIPTKVFHFICNIPRYSYKGTKTAVKYTYETIDAHPRIAASTFVISVVVIAALKTYIYKSLTSQEASHPIIAPFTLITAHVVSLATAMVAGLALASYLDKSSINRETNKLKRR